MADHFLNPPESDHVVGGRADRGKTAPRRTWMRNVESGEWIEMTRREDVQVPRATYFYDARDNNRYRLIDLGEVVPDPEDA